MSTMDAEAQEEDPERPHEGATGGEEGEVLIPLRIQVDGQGEITLQMRGDNTLQDVLDKLEHGARAGLFSPDLDQWLDLETPISLLPYQEMVSILWQRNMTSHRASYTANIGAGRSLGREVHATRLLRPISSNGSAGSSKL